MTSGTSSLPIPSPSKSSSIVTRDRTPSLRGSTVYLTDSLIGPPAPRAVQLLGGSISVSSEVVVRTAPPISRVVVYLEPTPGGAPPFMLPPKASTCHSVNREGSLMYAKTSPGGRAISVFDTIGVILLPPSRIPPRASRRGLVGPWRVGCRRS